MKQLERIRQMETRLDRAVAALGQLEEALDRWEALVPEMTALEDYYAGAWRQDFQDDEAGRLPPGLKRGVLSEDALWELLDRRDVLLERIAALVQKDRKPTCP